MDKTDLEFEDSDSDDDSIEKTSDSDSNSNSNSNSNKVDDDDVDGITLNELIIMHNIINIAAKRGAFGADEFRDIGLVFNRVKSFINKSVKERDEREAREAEEEKMKNGVTPEE